jgi:hypothetical protein
VDRSAPTWPVTSRRTSWPRGSPSAEVQIAYAIGVADPVSVNVDTFGTSKDRARASSPIVRDTFRPRPREIIEYLDLRRPSTGTPRLRALRPRERSSPWERTDAQKRVRAAAGSDRRARAARFRTFWRKNEVSCEGSRAGGQGPPASSGRTETCPCSARDPGVVQESPAARGLRIAACLHVTSESANLARARGRRERRWCCALSNPLTTRTTWPRPCQALRKFRRSRSRVRTTTPTTATSVAPRHEAALHHGRRRRPREHPSTQAP